MKRTLTPLQSVVLGFLTITLVGAFLLMLPISSSKGVWTSFADALFTAASCISTTGLVVMDTGSYFSLFGQIIVMLIFQIGGLGYMVFVVLTAYVLGGKPQLGHKVILKESMAGAPLREMKNFAKSVVLFTLAFELGGAILLSIYWMGRFPPLKAIWLGLFHSVSAFCTAGFGLFPDSFMSYQGSVFINAVILVVEIAGGIGFFVLYDLYGKVRKSFGNQWPRRLSLHSKLAMSMTAALIIIGAAVIFLAELGSSKLPIGNQVMAALFQAISAETTTGYNTVDIGAMKFPSLFMIIILMFVGASPGSTGGGIKTTTFGVILLFVLSLLRRSPDANFFKRRIPPEIIDTALAIAALSILLVGLVTLILTFTEKATFLQILFETVSAFGNAGLSTGITANLTPVGKVLLSITMFTGRVGPLSIGFSLLGAPRKVSFKYGRENVFVG